MMDKTAAQSDEFATPYEVPDPVWTNAALRCFMSGIVSQAVESTHGSIIGRY